CERLQPDIHAVQHAFRGTHCAPAIEDSVRVQRGSCERATAGELSVKVVEDVIGGACGVHLEERTVAAATAGTGHSIQKIIAGLDDSSRGMRPIRAGEAV